MEHVRAWVPLADGTRLAARLWLPDEVPAAVVLEALPYRMDDLTSSYRAEYERLCGEGGLAVARVDLRGTGSSEGVATDEYPPQEQADLSGGHRVARRTGVEQRPCRHVRDVLLGLQLHSARDGATAGARGDLRDLRDRRSLHGRRPLHGRRAPLHRPRGLRPLHGRDERAPTGAGRVRRRLARRMAEEDRQRRAVATAVARGAGRLPVLATRVAAARLRAHRMPDHDRRGLG